MSEISATQRAILGALAHREKHGRHLHHSACIHNLPPEEQVKARGKTVEWWLKFGPLPQQITPDDWECEPPADVIAATNEVLDDLRLDSEETT